MTRDLESQVDGIVTEFNGLPEVSLWEKTKKATYLLYALKVGGSLIPKYQKRFAKGIGWQEKDLTIRHAVYCTFIPAFFETAIASYFADKMNEPLTNTFLAYQSFYVVQGVLRTAYSQLSKKSTGAIELTSIVATPIYALQEMVSKYKERKKEVGTPTCSKASGLK